MLAEEFEPKIQTCGGFTTMRRNSQNQQNRKKIRLSSHLERQIP